MNRFRRHAVAAFLLALAAVSTASARARGNANLTAAASPRAVRASQSYSLTTEAVDLGGSSVVGSAAYTLGGTALGQPVDAPVQTSNAASYTDKPGFVGQLYDVRGLSVSGAGGVNGVNERATLQLAAAPLLDDGTLLAALAPGAVTWSVVSGPVVSVSASGLATADTVYQNTAATVRAASGGLSGTGTLVVINVNDDDYGSYAGDGIDDAWQVMYFGINNPQAGPLVDADGTGQDNLFKYLAGLDPLDPTARFVLSIAPVAGQPAQRTLIFSPVYGGRTYTVQTTSSLTQPNWTALNGATVVVNGTTETVTDPDASTAPRFYRVLVSLP